MYLISGIETFGKNAVVCGRSKNVGMPIAMLLHADGIYDTQAGMVGQASISNPYRCLLKFLQTADPDQAALVRAA